MNGIFFQCIVASRSSSLAATFEIQTVSSNETVKYRLVVKNYESFSASYFAVSLIWSKIETLLL